VKHLLRHELKEFAQVLVLANTPLSLFQGLTHCSGMGKLRECSPQALSDYYNRITARARRSEFVVALAYAVLSAILLHAREGNRTSIDASRLLWGEQIRDYLERSTVITQQHFLSPSTEPKIRAMSSVSASTSVILGPDGQPFR